MENYMSMKTDFKILVRLYYPALMTFLVFTFANNLLQGLISVPLKLGRVKY